MPISISVVSCRNARRVQAERGNRHPEPRPRRVAHQRRGATQLRLLHPRHRHDFVLLGVHRGQLRLRARRRRDGAGGRIARRPAGRRARRSAARAARHAVRQERFGRRDQPDDRAADCRVDCARQRQLGEARRRAQGQRLAQRADQRQRALPRVCASEPARRLHQQRFRRPQAQRSRRLRRAREARAHTRRQNLSMLFIGDYWKRDAECCIWTLRRTSATPSVIPEQQQIAAGIRFSETNQTQNIDGAGALGHQELRRLGPARLRVRRRLHADFDLRLASLGHDRRPGFGQQPEQPAQRELRRLPPAPVDAGGARRVADRRQSRLRGRPVLFRFARAVGVDAAVRDRAAAVLPAHGQQRRDDREHGAVRPGELSRHRQADADCGRAIAARGSDRRQDPPRRRVKPD